MSQNHFRRQESLSRNQITFSTEDKLERDGNDSKFERSSAKHAKTEKMSIRPLLCGNVRHGLNTLPIYFAKTLKQWKI